METLNPAAKALAPKAVTATRHAITLLDFSISFVPFALVLGAALLAPEVTDSMDPGFDRTVYTIWATALLVTPALCAFALPGDSQRKENVWLVFWTFSFVVYLVHVGYAIFAVYHGSGREILAGQGLFALVNNVIFTVWWAIDLWLAWFSPAEGGWIWKQRVAAHVYIGLTFFLSTVILKHGFINVIGMILTLSTLICLMVRFDQMRSQRARD